MGSFLTFRPISVDWCVNREGARETLNYQQLLQRTRQEHVLFSVLLELTYQCNLDCFYCYNQKGLTGKQLRLADYQQLLDDLAAMGALTIALSGGEPLAHPDFMAIGRYARDLGFVVRVKSNGHALTEERALKVQQEIDPFCIELSLHGANAKTHDKQTRVPGSFRRLMRNIEVMQELGLRLQFNATMTAWNEGEFEGMFNLADRFGILLMMDDKVTMRDNGDMEPVSIAPSISARRKLTEFRKKRSKRLLENGVARPESLWNSSQENGGGNHCGAGTTTLLVNPFGDVYPCVNWRRSIGNLHRERVTEIWSDSAPLEAVRQLQRQIFRQRRQLNPAFRNVSFCPGIAEQETSEPGSDYPHTTEALSMVLK